MSPGFDELTHVMQAHVSPLGNENEIEIEQSTIMMHGVCTCVVNACLAFIPREPVTHRAWNTPRIHTARTF